MLFLPSLQLLVCGVDENTRCDAEHGRAKREEAHENCGSTNGMIGSEVLLHRHDVCRLAGF